MSAMPVRVSLLALAAASLTACTTAPDKAEMAVMERAQQKVLLPATRAERDEADKKDMLFQAAFWNTEFDKNPGDTEAALKLCKALRGIGSSQRATEIASQVLALRPEDVELAMVYAQASLDIGRADQAVATLARAEAAGQRDWRMLSLIGVVMDQNNRSEAAQSYYQRALALSPENIAVLSNLGLSYALAGKPDKAEEVLRHAMTLPAADSRIRQNLVIVLGVQGKFDELAKVAGPDTPKTLVDASQEYYRTMLSPSRKWDQLRGTSN